jgi:ABC-type transport system substrate-binding protein
MVGTIYLFLNVQFKPLNNVLVRQAISWAINRPKLVKLLGGQGQALYQLYPPGMPGYIQGKQWYGYDPAKAKQLLAEAGFPNGFKTTVYSDNVDPNPKIVQSIQADLANVGIKAAIKVMNNSSYYTFVTTPHAASMGTDLWYMDFPDPFDWMPLFTKSAAVAGGMNNSFWWGQNVENLITQAQATSDAKARIAKYDEIQAAIMEQAPYVTLYSPVTTTMFSKNVGGFYYNPTYGYDPVNYWHK